MVGVLKRYKIIFVILTLIILTALAWLSASRQDLNEVPLRGVFVMRRGIHGQA